MVKDKVNVVYRGFYLETTTEFIAEALFSPWYKQNTTENLEELPY